MIVHDISKKRNEDDGELHEAFYSRGQVAHLRKVKEREDNNR